MSTRRSESLSHPQQPPTRAPPAGSAASIHSRRPPPSRDMMTADAGSRRKSVAWTVVPGDSISQAGDSRRRSASPHYRTSYHETRGSRAGSQRLTAEALEALGRVPSRAGRSRAPVTQRVEVVEAAERDGGRTRAGSGAPKAEVVGGRSGFGRDRSKAGSTVQRVEVLEEDAPRSRHDSSGLGGHRSKAGSTVQRVEVLEEDAPRSRHDSHTGSQATVTRWVEVVEEAPSVRSPASRGPGPRVKVEVPVRAAAPSTRSRSSHHDSQALVAADAGSHISGSGGGKTATRGSERRSQSSAAASTRRPSESNARPSSHVPPPETTPSHVTSSKPHSPSRHSTAQPAQPPHSQQRTVFYVVNGTKFHTKFAPPSQRSFAPSSPPEISAATARWDRNAALPTSPRAPRAPIRFE